jgi:hypothetical protein
MFLYRDCHAGSDCLPLLSSQHTRLLDGAFPFRESAANFSAWGKGFI